MLVLPLDLPGSLLQGICLVVVYNVSRSLFCDRVYVSSKVYSSQDNLVLSTELIMHTGHYVSPFAERMTSSKAN